MAGFLLLDKPSGMTSNAALQKVKRLYDARKAGHTGSLDPLATGMLPICFGKATRLSQYLLSANKEYLVEAKLGQQTDTDDADGTIIAEAPVPGLHVDAVRAVLAAFEGEQLQTPPMYSALKKDGRPLYELARRGIDVERKPRRVVIYAIELLSVESRRLEFRVICSKGTYVRSLVGDIAAALGTLGHVSSLRRLAVDPFGSRAMAGFPELEERSKLGFEALDELLEPIDVVLAAWPRIDLSDTDVENIRHGRSVPLSSAVLPGRYRLYSPQRAFVGIGEVAAGGLLSPRRIFL